MALNKKLLEENADRLDSAPLKLIEDAKKLESKLLTEALSVNFEQGVTKQNLIELENLINRISALIREGEFSVGMAEYLKSFDANARNSIEFLKNSFDDVSVSDKVRDVIISNKQQTVNVITGTGLDAVTSKIKTQLTNAMASNATKEEIGELLTSLLVSNDQRLSEITRHVSQNAFDRIAFSDRSFIQVLNEDIGAEWYIYFGGKSKDTREFCLERNGKYYHSKEIQAWGMGRKTSGLRFPKSGTWQGRIPTTNAGNIFVNLGGYNCQHYLMPVSVFDVDSKAIQRNIASGNFKPTETEKKLLNL